MKTTRKPGYALATILILMGVALFGIGALVTTSTLEAKISRSQVEGTSSYYVADAGMADAVWRLNTNTTYEAALANGTLNVTYTTTNVPQSGQGYTVVMKTSAQGAGYATVTVDATSNNGTFVAHREVQSNIFGGQSANATLGNDAVLAGGNFSISGSGNVNITNGDLYTNGNAGFIQTNVNMSPNWIRAVGNYSKQQGNVNARGISATNFPAAAAAVSVPGINFSYYQTNNTTSYTAAQFTTAIKNANVNATFSGPVTYVNGNVTITNSIGSGKNITITGLLVVNGTLTINSGISNLVMNVNDPGNGLSGIIASSNVSLSSGNLNVNGLLYSAGNYSITNVSNLTVSGAIVSPFNVAITPGSNVTLNYTAARPNAVFANGTNATAQALQVQHWEEDY